jgi:hypothetical protein
MWAYWARYAEPDEIVHECVAGFDEAVFEEIFGRIDGLIKSPLAKPIPTGLSYCGYRMRSQVFSPVDIGVPTDRTRRYGFYRLDYGAPKLEIGLSFEDVMFRRLCASPAVYLLASSVEAEAEAAEIVDRRRDVLLDEHLSVAERRMRHGEFVHLEGYDVIAKRAGLKDAASGQWTVDVALVNLAQRPEFFSHVSSKAVPAILRKSALYDLVRGRFLTSSELWSAQGYPYPFESIEGRFPPARLPFGSLLGKSDGGANISVKLARGDQLSLLGNCMHGSQVGHWVLYNVL